jgi:alcohol dehydrogenase
VFNTAEVREGDSVAVFGCGGVGLAAIMGARVAGAGAIVAVDVVATRLERALDAGADTALLSHPLVAEEIVELTQGGVSCAIEAAGLASAIEAAYRSTAVGGQVVTVGLAHPQAEIRLRPADLVATGRRLVGSYMGSAVPQRDVPRLVALFERSRMPLQALVGQRHRLTDFERALRALGDDGPGRQVFLT